MVISADIFAVLLRSLEFYWKFDNGKKYYVFMKIRPLIGRGIRMGSWIHVNQPYYC